MALSECFVIQHFLRKLLLNPAGLHEVDWHGCKSLVLLCILKHAERQVWDPIAPVDTYVIHRSTPTEQLNMYEILEKLRSDYN